MFNMIHHIKVPTHKMFNMIHHIKVPIHKMGHTLDIVATFKTNPVVTDIEANEYDIRHHFLIAFLVAYSPEIRQYKVISYRNIKSVDSEKVSLDINNKLNEFQQSSTFGIKVKGYTEVMEEVLHEHAPLETRRMKIVLHIFVPIWLELINISLAEGSMECLKSAIILPLIKEIGEFMDNDILENYRPVSNLLFLAKLIEKIVSIRLNKTYDREQSPSEFQYGYKRGDSTETLLPKVVNDLLMECDEQNNYIDAS